MSFRTAYQDENDALLVVQPKKISIHYLKTWFLIDFVSTFPIDHIVVWTSSDGGSSGTRVVKASPHSAPVSFDEVGQAAEATKTSRCYS